MTSIDRQERPAAEPRWVPEKPVWKKAPNDWGMRAAGRLAVGLNTVFGSCARGRVGILMYHRVTPVISRLPAPLHNVTPQAFQQQLRGLLRRGFQFASLGHVLDAAAHGEALPAKTVVVTFDDGFASVYEHGWPVLKTLGIPATVFVNTAYLDSPDPFPFEAWGVAHAAVAPAGSYRPLTTDQCRSMIEDGLVELGAHTHTHKDFRGRPADFREDLAKSTEVLWERFGLNGVTFAFPYGSRQAGFAGGPLRSAAESTGVRCGLTTAPDLVELSQSPFEWGRFNVFSWDTAATLSGKLGGWYSWAPHLRQSVARKLRMGSARTASVAGLASAFASEAPL